jgi:fructosamine-3-kinase
MASRKDIYYWKCDRPTAFFAIKGENDTSLVEKGIREVLADYFGDNNFTLSAGIGQGNHLTYTAVYNEENYFVRVENGSEGDQYMDVETAIMEKVRLLGVPTPQIYAVDARRKRYPFAWQLMDMVPYPDLNKLYKSGELDALTVMRQLGRYIATWQQIETPGYGPYNTDILRYEGQFVGLHKTYRDYYMLNLQQHLDYLVQKDFLDEKQTQHIAELVKANDSYLDIPQGCLVHKDIALWNILGDSKNIRSIIDFDDCISGDPTDDLSLMGCFHSGDEMRMLFEGYKSVKPLPEEYERRFWLHLLRNIIFKAVIRVGAGYFEKGNGFFLVNSSEGSNLLRQQTHYRITSACEGLRGDKDIFEL